MMENEFGKALKKARINAGMTQEQLGEKIGYTKQTISNWEMGKTNMSFEDRLRLQDLLGFEPDPGIKRKEQVDKVRLLQEIRTEEDLDATIDRILKSFGFRSPFEIAVNYMLKKTLWVYAGNFVYQNILYELYHEKHHTEKEPFYFDWFDVDMRFGMIINESKDNEPNEYIPNAIAATIYNEMDEFRKMKINNALTEYYGQEGSFIRELEDANDPDFEIAMTIASRSDHEAGELIKLFPNNESETSVITEFRRALIELKLNDYCPTLIQRREEEND